MKTQTLKIADIEVDLSIQPRAHGLSQEHAEDLAEAYRRDDEIPPIMVFRIGKLFKLAKGFHRIEGAKRAGKKELACQVEDGTDTDCALAALCSNQSHGLKRTNEDKRRCVEEMLKLVPDWSDRRIADEAGVGHPLVASLRPKPTDVESDSTSTRTDKKGNKRPAKQPAKQTKPATSDTATDNGRTDPSANSTPVHESTPEHHDPDADSQESEAAQEPEHPADAFADQLATICRELDAAKKGVKDAAAVAVYGKHLHAESVVQQIEAARKALWQSRPTEPCNCVRNALPPAPECKACFGTGRTTPARVLKGGR